MNKTLLALASDGGTTLALAGAGAPLVDRQARTISGLAVPYGPVGATSMGRLQFSAGSLTWVHASRVKLLREHDQRDSVGVGRVLEDLDAAEVDRRMTAAGRDPVGVGGLWATFHVPAGENGDRALAEAESGLRDAFSVGVQLDDKSAQALRRANGGPVQGTGALREVSLVAVPAFDDARVGSVAANAQLVVSSWSTTTAGDPVRCSVCHHVHAAGVTACQPDHLAAAQAALAAASTPPAETPAPTPTPTNPATPTQPAAPAPQEPAPTPAPLAVAGAALVTSEPTTYNFADEMSLVRDAFNGRVYGDGEAAGRVARFNQELAAGNPASVMALAAVMTTDDADSIPLLAPNVRRPDLMLTLIDRGRPVVSRIPSVPIRNAQPFLIPTLGEFTGVGAHTEGTAHAPEGSLDLDEVPFVPKAMSGAFRVSREMIDSSNPAIDRLALTAMLRDYRKQTEAAAVAALIAGLAAVASVDTVAELRTQLLGFGDDDIVADVVLAGRSFFNTIAGETAADGRPVLPYVGPSNAVGTIKAGYTGASIDGTDIAKTSSIATGEALIVDASGVLVAESPAQTFRFDEVEGPGIIKLALFGYFGAKVLRVGSVKRLKTAA